MATLKFKLNDLVAQVLPAPFKGNIVEAHVDEHLEVHYRVEHIDDLSDVRSKWFTEEQIEAVAAAVAAAVPAP